MQHSANTCVFGLQEIREVISQQRRKCGLLEAACSKQMLLKRRIAQQENSLLFELQREWRQKAVSLFLTLQAHKALAA